MRVELIKSKMHQARITDCLIEYEGSLAIDQDLMDRVGMFAYEKILVVNATNGERLVTYAIPGERGSGQFVLNGAAARRGARGDVITIMSFAQIDAAEAPGFTPKVVVLDAENRVVRTRGIDG